jgi:dimethylargininase
MTMPHLVAMTRKVSRSIGQCELTHLPRSPIDYPAACAQHQDYENALAALSCRVISLPAEDTMPDAVFVEDTAVVLNECAVITRPGAVSRRGESPAIAQALSPFRQLVNIEPPGTLDGGDVMRVGHTLYVGISGRTNHSGVHQLREAVRRYGYTIVEVPVQHYLHLKAAVTCVSENTVLINPRWVDESIFHDLIRIPSDPDEPMAANALPVNGIVIYPSRYPGTRARLERSGISIYAVDLSELAKAEGAVTCCSLIIAEL